jgi:hypothetical protein
MTEYATQKISLWIENTESLLNAALSVITEEMRQGNVWDAGTALAEWFETECDESTVNDFAWSILTDLMGPVDWSEIAETIWGDGTAFDIDDYSEYSYDEMQEMFPDDTDVRRAYEIV